MLEPRQIGFPHPAAAADEGMCGKLFAAVRDAVAVGIIAAAIDGPRIVGDAPPDKTGAGRLFAAADRDIGGAARQVALLVRRVELDVDALNAIKASCSPSAIAAADTWRNSLIL